jgi:hypothetical protein
MTLPLGGLEAGIAEMLATKVRTIMMTDHMMV